MFSDKSVDALRRSIEKGEPETGPTDIQVLPTPRCNAACTFCPLHAIPDPLMKKTPRFSTYKNDLSGGLLDRLADDLFHLGGLKRVTLTGGEPLLYTHIVPAIFQFSHSFPEAELTLVTNGIRLQSFAPFLVRGGVHNIIVSINAGTPKSYRAQNPAAKDDTFRRIVEGVSAVTAEKKSAGSGRPHVNLSVVLTRESAGDVEALFELGRKTGVNAVTFLPLMEIRLEGESVNKSLAAGADEFASFIDKVKTFSERAAQEGFYLGYAGSEEGQGLIVDQGMYKRQPCYAGYTFAAIYPNGDVRPCCHCEPIMGNLRENSIGEIWHSERYREYRKKMLSLAENGGALEGCLCGECGYSYENVEFHKRLG